MPHSKLSLQTSSKQTTIVIDQSSKAKPTKESKGQDAVHLEKAKVVCVSTKDSLENVQVNYVEQQQLLPCLKLKLAAEIITKEKDAYKKANWKAMFQFAKELEKDVNNLLEHPQVLNKLGSESILTLMKTLNTIGESLMWAEDRRRNKLKDVFSPFMPGYEAEIKAYETSYARLNTMVRALNPIYELKLETEKAELLQRQQVQDTKGTLIIKADQLSVKIEGGKATCAKSRASSESDSLDSSSYDDLTL